MNNQIYNRGKENRPPLPPPPQKKKMDFRKYKINTINSLNEVECFLHNIRKVTNYIKLYKILK